MTIFRTFGWLFLLFGGVLIFVGIASSSSGELMFGLPYLLLMAGVPFVVLGGVFVLLSRRYSLRASRIRSAMDRVREESEIEAGKYAEKYAGMSADELVQRVRDRKYDEYFQLWHALPGKVEPDRINHLFRAVLESDEEYLQRYHCAAAFIAINGLNEFEPCQLSARETQPVSENLRKALARVSRSKPDCPDSDE